MEEAGMSIKWVEYRATVPDWSVPDLNQKVAELSVQAKAMQRVAPDETEEQRVRRTLEMIKTDGGMAFLKLLAHESQASTTGWVPWGKLCHGMGMNGKQLSGVLGNIVKSTRDVTPLYQREQTGDRYRFRMTPEVAEVVIVVSGERVAGSVKAIADGDSDIFL
jgi:hypothetical protein